MDNNIVSKTPIDNEGIVGPIVLFPTSTGPYTQPACLSPTPYIILLFYSSLFLLFLLSFFFFIIGFVFPIHLPYQPFLDHMILVHMIWLPKV